MAKKNRKTSDGGVARHIEQTAEPADAIRDRMAAIGMLAAGIAHEINNPLSYILSNLRHSLDILDSTNGLPAGARAELEEPLKDALEGAEKVRSIVRDLRLLSQTDEEKLEPVDIRAVMSSAINIAWNEIRHRARIEKHFADVPLVSASQGRLAQVFLNLLINAAHSISPGFVQQNCITITIDNEASGVVATITDTGEGIPDDIKQRIFEPFFTTKSRDTGTGLGLSICKNYLAQMRASISFSTKVGEGSAFSVHFPRMAESKKNRPCVMVIDDDNNVLKAMQRMLHREFNVHTFSDARLACSEVGRIDPDLILCDLVMPDFSGPAVLEELKAMQRHSCLAFITGSLAADYARQFIAESQRPCLEKPFDIAEVRALVRRTERVDKLMKVLIAEDERFIRRALVHTVERLGYEVSAVENGSDALSVLSTDREIRLALLDWVMPGIDGIEVVRALRSQRVELQPYVILVTARTGADDVASGLNSGADDYIVKPFQPTELEARLRAGRRLIEARDQLSANVTRLQEALDDVKRLQGLLPICMHCKSIRDDKQSWRKLEEYISSHSEARFSHGICDPCMRKHHG